MAARAVTALFDRYEAAAAAIERLEAAGIPHADISIVGNRSEDAPEGSAPGTTAPAGQAEASAAGSTGAGATVGTVLGGGAGLLAGLGLLAIPGLGPVVAAGWLVSAVTGAGVGAAAGGLIGGLTGTGLSEGEARTYAEGVRRGGTLVTVRVDADRADRVLEILDAAGSIDLDERAENWRAQGWTGGTAGPAVASEGAAGRSEAGRPAVTIWPTGTPEG
ncbi:hypothetical protein Q8W71_08150 [Methylobacterium sp. NEAU 140]|uniref:hypothetical protein n=1 Tax=Methylobacterium sp. NEAU 140 TaxID=3064945 RepID=UPI0027367049|nr:hypothetical protein [Methylobacterium sp. NEAU 140]MDP4022589.1 hypothetical protein [Methylobacterium sp. NEAU 140]